MSKTTDNYGLIKPELTDSADITAMNKNWDKIDDELLKRVPVLAKYYSPQSDGGISADDLIDPFALIPVSSELNPELYAIVGGTFAWVWTNFYIKADVTSRRMQIAMSYNTVNHKMAFRIYDANGWLGWKELVTTDAIPNHAASHKTGGADAISPADIGALLSTLPTITDADSSIGITTTGIKIERYAKDTLNTPYKAGLTTNPEGVIISASSKNVYATQFAFALGGRGLFIRPNIAGSVYDWSEFGDFKSDGSKAMSGKVLNMQDGRSCLEVNGNVIGLRVRETANDDTNSARLTLDNGYGLSRKLFLRITQNGSNTDYDLYGEHNKPTKADVGLGNVPNVATNDQTPTYSDNTTLATLASGEKLNVALQKIKCAITNLINHLNNKSNPHGVTASQVGLKTETWTFTLEDGSTVTKAVYVG